MDLIDAIHVVSAPLPRDERFGLTSQIRRAAVSVAANIAEGKGRDHLGDYTHHLSMALGSVAEVDALLEVCCRRGFIDRHSAEPIFAMVNGQGRVTKALLRSLKPLG